MNPESEHICKRIEASLTSWGDKISGKRMFGGYCFLYSGKMCVGETKGRLVVRVPADKMEAALKMPHVSPMDFTGKPMKEFVFVDKKGFDTEEKLQHWIELGIAHAKSKVGE